MAKKPLGPKWWERPEWAGVLYACQACALRFYPPPESGKCERCDGDMTAHFPPKPTPEAVELRVCGNVLGVDDSGDPQFCGSESDDALAIDGVRCCPDCKRPRARALVVTRSLNDEERATIGARNATRSAEFDRIFKYPEA